MMKVMKSLETAVSKEPIRLQGWAGYSRVNTMSLREKKENTTFMGFH